MSYEDLLREAVQAYTDRLRRIVRLQGSTALRAAASALIETIELAWVRRGAMTADDCQFTVATLRGLQASEQFLLLDEHALGFGRPDAPTIIVGTEPAYDLGKPEDAVSFCLESCTQLAVLLSDGNAAVTARLSGGAVRLPDNRPFHIYPNDHYRAHGAHTWARLARVVGLGSEHQPGAAPGLGDLCYQLDLSAFPCQHGGAGRPPTPARLHFLEHAMTTFSATARTLLFHGKAASPEWSAARAPLIACFLGRAPTASEWHDDSEPQRPLHHATVGPRRVIVTRALADQGVTPDFLSRLARLVQPAAGVPRRRRIITVPPPEAAQPPRRTPSGTSPNLLAMDRHRLLQLCLAQGLETNRESQWTQVGPPGAIGSRSYDSRVFYVNHSDDVVDLRRHSAPHDLMSRAVDAGGDVQHGQIVARIPVTLFSEVDWIRVIRHNA